MSNSLDAWRKTSSHDWHETPEIVAALDALTGIDGPDDLDPDDADVGGAAFFAQHEALTPHGDALPTDCPEPVRRAVTETAQILKECQHTGVDTDSKEGVCILLAIQIFRLVALKCVYQAHGGETLAYLETEAV